MACLRALLLVTALPAAAGRRAASARGARAFLSGASDLRPDIVAKSFAGLADNWRQQAKLFVECNASVGDAGTNDTAVLAPCSSGPKAFEKSCATVAAAVLRASSGEKDTVKEYMGDVCGEPRLAGWKAAGCKSFAEAVVAGMSPDSFANRQHPRAGSVCRSFWPRFLAREQELLAEERKERAEEEKRQEAARADAMKKAGEEAARKATEEAQAEEERRKKEEVDRQEKAKKEAASEQAAAQKRAEQARHNMRQAQQLADAKTPIVRAPASASVSGAEAVLAASADVLAASETAGAPVDLPSGSATAKEEGAVAPVATNSSDVQAGNASGKP